MGTMGVLAAVLAVVVVLGILGLLARRHSATEAHSVEGYRHTLSTLQEIRSRAAPTSVRVGDRGGLTGDRGAGGGTGDGATGGEAAGHQGVNGAAAGPRRGMVFDDATGTGGWHGDVRVTRRGQRRAMSAMNHGPRRVVGPILVTLILLALIGAVVEVGLHSRSHPKRPTADRTTRSTKATTKHAGHSPAQSTTHRRTTATTAGSTTPHKPRAHHTPTTTTPTAPPSFTAVSSSAYAATYTLPDASYTLSLATTTGPCWINVTGPGSAQLFTETMPAGTSHTVAANGPVQVVLGAPTVISVEVDGTPVVLPSGYQTPFTMTLQPGS